MGNIFDTLRSLGAPRLIVLGAVTLGMVGFFAFMTNRVSTGSMELLYADLSSQDATAIAGRLATMGINHTLSVEGDSIMVPSSEVARVRMSLAQEGLPSGGSVGYELFDENQGFATTSFVQQINQVRALEGELARTIATLSAIRAARVHLVFPKREMFSRESTKPSASVFLQLGPGATLGGEQIAAVQALVAAAVPNLNADDIAVVDQRGSLLARPVSEAGGGGVAADGGNRRSDFETRLKQSIEEIVTRVVGYGKVRANVSADLDFDRIVTSEERFDPNEQVVRSTQTVEETDQSSRSNGENNQPVTVANNLPGEGGVEGGEGEGGLESLDTSSRIEETTNFEISRIVRDHVRETGVVRKLSVAVLVDGSYTTDAEGNTSYTPRSAEELERIEALVRTTVGFDASRGDQIELVNLRFVEEEFDVPEGLAAADLFGFPKSDLLKIAETAVVGLVAILVLLLVVRPLLSRLMTDAQAVAGGGEGRPLLAAPDGGGMMAMPGGGGMAAYAQAGALPMREGAAPQLVDDGKDGGEEDRMIDINQVEGRVRQSSIKKVGEIVDKHPTEAVAIVRSWLYQEG